MPLDEPRRVPDWVADYIGIPFVAKGRDRAGCDCWGLVRLVLAERYGFDLPSYAEGYDSLEDLGAIVELIGGAREGGAWRRIDAEEAEAGDLAVLRGVPTPHIGVLVAQGLMLHALQGAEASLARLSDQAWRHRLEATQREPYSGYYRYQGSEVRDQGSEQNQLIPDPCSLIPAGLEGEILEPGEGEVDVVVCPHPFRVEKRVVRVPAGLSLEEIFAQEQPDPLLRLHGAAWIGDQRIVPRAAWRRVRPKPGARVTIRALPPVPRGGDRKVLRAVLMVAVIAAAVAAPYIIPGLVAGTLTAGLVSAGIAIGGSLLVNALLPVQAKRLERGTGSSDSPTFSIEGAQNLLRPYEPIPRPLGRHRFVGHLGARTYRQIVAGEVYFRILLIWGTGPLEVTDIKIGETPIEDFDDVQIETRQGLPGDAPLTLYTNDVFEEVPGVTLTEGLGFVTRRSQANAEEIDLDFTFPRGLVWIDGQDGRRKTREVLFKVQYAPAGTEDWSSDEQLQAVAGGSLNLGDTPTGVIEYHPGEDRFELVTEPASRYDAVVIDRFSREISVIKGQKSYRRKERRGFFEDELTFWRIVRPLPGIPANKVSLAWVKRIWNPFGTGAIPADRVIDRRSSPDGGRRPARVQFNTSDVLPGTDRIRQPTGFAKFRDNELLRLGSSGTLPGGLPAGTGVFVVNAADETYQLSLSEGGEPIAITDRGSGTHYASDILGTPATDFPVTTAAPTAKTVNYGAGSLLYSGFRVRAATTQAYRVGLNFQVPKGQYDVRVKRLTNDSSDELISDEAVWTGLRSITYQDPFDLAGVARSAILIRATEQLEGRVEPISAVLTSLAKVWDAGKQQWTDDEPTSNPAALFRLVAQDAANRAARTDAQLDLPALEAWHEVCEAQGWAFNMVVDFRTTVPEMLGMIAAAGMASVSLPDGRLSVVQDIDKTVPVQHISPRNSHGYQGQVTYPQVPHGWRVRFIDETNGWKNNERIVYDDGYSAANASKLMGIEFPGVTDPELIWRHARRRIAEARLRPETHRVSMDIEGLVATRGDLVRFSHDAVKVGLGHGRLKAVALGGGGEATGVSLDAAVPMEAGKSYVIRMRDETGLSVLAPVVTAAGEQTEVTFVTPITNPTIRAGDIFLFGELGLESRELIVTGIQPDAELGFTLTMVDLAREVFKADDLAVSFAPGDVDAGADSIGPPGHGFFDGDRVMFATDGSLPRANPVLVEGRTYQVVDAAKDSYRISEDLDSDPATAPIVDLLDGGSGVHSAARAIPPFDAGISQDPVLPELQRPAAPVIEEIRSDESVMVRGIDGTWQARVAIRFSVPPTTTRPEAVEAQIRDGEGGLSPRQSGFGRAGGPWRRALALLLPAEELLIGDVDQLGRYDLRIRSITSAGIPSDWTSRLGYQVLGATAPPPDVTNLLVDQGLDLLTWELVNPPFDLAGFRIKWHYGTDQTWQTGILFNKEPIQSREVSIAAFRGQTTTVMVKALDRYGTESVNAAVVTIDLVLSTDSPILESRDLKAEGFPGTIVGADVLGSGPTSALNRGSDAPIRNGSLVGDPQWVKGLLAPSTGSGSALRFDGEDRYVSCGDLHQFTGRAPFTIIVRFRPRIPVELPGTPGNHYVLVNNRAPAAVDGWTMWVSGSTDPAQNGRLRFIRHSSNGADLGLVSVKLEDQRVYEAAAVYDGTNCRMVLDGETVAGPLAHPLDVEPFAGDFRIGGDTNLPAFRFDGVIDTVQVWDVALSNSEIVSYMAEPLDRGALDAAKEAGLVGYWPFNEGTIDGDMEALPLRTWWIPDGDELPAWDLDDNNLAWLDPHMAIEYDFTHTPSRELVPGELRRGFAIEGRSLQARVFIENSPAWRKRSDDFAAWGADDGVLYWHLPPISGPYGGYQLWPGRLGKVTGETLDFRIDIGASRQQGKLTQLRLDLTDEIVEERFEDLVVREEFTRLPVSEPWRRYTEITATLQDDGSDAVKVVVSKKYQNPPWLVGRDINGDRAKATVDLVVRGIR